MQVLIKRDERQWDHKQGRIAPPDGASEGRVSPMLCLCLSPMQSRNQQIRFWCQTQHGLFFKKNQPNKQKTNSGCELIFPYSLVSVGVIAAGEQTPAAPRQRGLQGEKGTKPSVPNQSYWELLLGSSRRGEQGYQLCGRGK